MASKKHLTLSIDSEIADRAVADPDIKVSELTEKILRAFTSSSKTQDNEKRYQGYQEIFNLMLPLLRKFKVSTKIAYEVLDWGNPQAIEWDDNGNETNWDAEPTQWCDYYLQPNGKILRDQADEIEIKDIKIEDFFRPQNIIDNLLDSIQEGVVYRKNQFKEIDMAKALIDIITKGVISKRKSVKK